jgi:hypothetical protein
MRGFRMGLLLLACLVLSPAYGAGYLKLRGIDGTSKDSAHRAAPSAPSGIKGADDAQETGLLLPAVQKAHDARRGKPKGKVEYQWKVEEGVK